MAQTYIPSTNTDPTKAAFGQSGAGVLAYQQGLNKQFAGQEGWTPLAEDGKYGPLTQAASQFKPKLPEPPKDTGTPAGSPSSTNIIRTPPKQSPEEAYLGGGAFEQPKSYDDNYTTLLGQSKGLLDSINANFKNELESANAASSARVNAGGLAGSTAGGTIYNKAQRPIIDRANMELEKVYASLRGDAQSLTQMQKENATTDAKNYVAMQEANKAKTEGYLKTLAANPQFNWDDYKTQQPEMYNHMLESVGGDSTYLDGLFVSNIPKAELLDDKPILSGNNAVWFQKTNDLENYPNGLKPVVLDVGVDLAGTDTKNKQVLRVPGDGVYIIDKATGKATRVQGPSGGSSGVEGLTAAQINSTVNQIAGAFDNEPIVKEFNTIRRNVDTFNNLGTSPTDDIQRVYTFAKVADPNSAVKEGEYNSIEKYSQALLERTGLKVKRVFDAQGILTTEAREAMKKTLKTSLDASRNAYKNVESEYKRQIQDAYSGNQRNITNYDPEEAQDVSSAEVGTAGTLDNGTEVVKASDGKWYDQDGNSYDADGNPL